MKKLLTMMVSCASALFAMADDTWSSGTGFQGYGAVEGGPAIPLNINKDDNGGDGDRYWYSKTSTDGIVEAAVTNNGTTAYLMLDTSEVLERTIGGYDTSGGTTTFVSKSLSGGAIYFDSKVQFTATEDGVTPNPGDKLVVWLKAVEGTDAVGTEGEEDYVAAVPASTNLMITAGLGLDDFNHAIPTNFVASGVTIEPNSWHQLTIKAFVKEDNCTYFNVYIDGAPVTGILEGDDSVTKTDFESLVSNADTLLNPTTITSVGFRGTGAVDDLAFTTSNPLGFSVTATIDGEKDAVATAQYSVDGSTWVDVTSGSSFTVPASTENITFKVIIASGWKLDGGDMTSGEDGEGNCTWTKLVSVSSVNNAITLTVVQDGQTDPEPGTELPAVKPDGEKVTETEYTPAAEKCLKDYFPTASEEVPDPELAVIINGVELFGDAAVAAINDIADKFTGNPFDADGTIEVVFKVDDVMKALEGAADGYTLTVGAAGLKDTYEVAPKFIDLANPGVEIADPGENATEKFFKLVIKEKMVE